MKETEMHEPVKNLLISQIFCDEVYAEIMNVDMLGIKGPANIIVEMKVQLSFKLIEQAYRSLQYAQYVYIAIPRLKASYHWIYYQFLKPKRIGLIEVSGDQATIIYPAKFNHAKKAWVEYIRKHIEEFSHENIAGSKGGETITRYSYMMKRVKRYMQNRGWVTVDEILDHCETYYAQPKPSMIATLKADYNANWCEFKIINGKTCFKHRGEQKNEQISRITEHD